MLMRDRASGVAMVELFKKYGGAEGPPSWEPKSEDVIRIFGRWMMFYPLLPSGS